MSKVYFASARVKKWRYEDSMPGKLDALFKKLGLMDYFSPAEWVAVKTHFGSEGAHRIVRPVFLRKITEALKRIGAKPFVTDTVRIKGLDYLEVANQNGINHLSVGAPVVLADGLYGNDNIMVKAGDILGEVAVASLIHDVPAMVVCSHIKGHINAGYAGAIKNLAMGGVSAYHRTCGWKCGRGSMHTIGEGELVWDESKCELCYQCRDICPMDAIEFKEGELVWEGDNCWRCGLQFFRNRDAGHDVFDKDHPVCRGAINFLKKRPRGNDGLKTALFPGVPGVSVGAGRIIDHHRRPAAHKRPQDRKRTPGRCRDHDPYTAIFIFTELPGKD